MIYRYRQLDASEVDLRDRSLCEFAVEVGSLMLGISKPNLRFIVEFRRKHDEKSEGAAT